MPARGTDETATPRGTAPEEKAGAPERNKEHRKEAS